MFYAIVERARAGCGRNGDETWVNVVVGTHLTRGEVPAAARDPGGATFYVELTEAEYFALQGFSNKFDDDDGRIPKHQQRVAGDRPQKEFGSFAVPSDHNSGWRANTPRSRND